MQARIYLVNGRNSVQHERFRLLNISLMVILLSVYHLLYNGFFFFMLDSYYF